MIINCDLLKFLSEVKNDFEGQNNIFIAIKFYFSFQNRIVLEMDIAMYALIPFTFA